MRETSRLPCRLDALVRSPDGFEGAPHLGARLPQQPFELHLRLLVDGAALAVKAVAGAAVEERKSQYQLRLPAGLRNAADGRRIGVVERLHDGREERQVVRPGVAQHPARRLRALPRRPHVRTVLFGLPERIVRRRRRSKHELLGDLDGALRGHQDTERFASTDEIRLRLGELRLVRGELLPGADLVKPVPAAHFEAGVRVIEMRTGAVASLRRDLHQAMLRDHRDVRACRCHGDEPARVFQRDARDVHLVARVRPCQPALRDEERHREVEVGASRAERSDRTSREIALGVVARRDSVRGQEGQRGRAHLLEDSLGAADLLLGDESGGIARRGAPDGLVQGDPLLRERRRGDHEERDGLKQAHAQPRAGHLPSAAAAASGRRSNTAPAPGTA